MTEQLVGVVHESSHIYSLHIPIPKIHLVLRGTRVHRVWKVEKEGGVHLYSYAEVMIHEGARFFW